MVALLKKHVRYYEMKQCFDQNLDEIESVATEERRELLRKNGAQMQKLFDLFSKMEQGHLEERQKRVENQQNDLAALRLHDAEDYTSLKVQTVQHMQQQHPCKLLRAQLTLA